VPPTTALHLTQRCNSSALKHVTRVIRSHVTTDDQSATPDWFRTYIGSSGHTLFWLLLLIAYCFGTPALTREIICLVISHNFLLLNIHTFKVCVCVYLIYIYIQSAFPNTFIGETIIFLYIEKTPILKQLKLDRVEGWEPFSLQRLDDFPKLRKTDGRNYINFTTHSNLWRTLL